MATVAEFLSQLQALIHVGGTTESADYIFMPQNKAREALINRAKDAELKKRIRESISAEARAIIRFDPPRAMLFRQVATPTHEILRFLRIARHMKLTPIILEYYGDKFVSSGNPYKRALGKMPIYQHTGTDGRDHVRYRTVVDFNSYTGKPLSEVKCGSGEPLIDFHHRLLDKMTRLKIEAHTADATAWFKELGGVAQQYYEGFLTLFIRDAILFEYFEPTQSEQKFIHETMLPALHKVSARFGLQPLIVRLVPKNKEGRKIWETYPKKIEQFIDI